MPPSREVLHKRLSNRDMKDKLIASERMKEFYKDIKHWVDYDYVVVNDDLQKCYEEISNVIDNGILLNQNISYNKQLISKHIEKLVS